MADFLRKFFEDRSNISMDEKSKRLKRKHRLKAMKTRKKLMKEVEDDKVEIKKKPKNEVEKWAEKKRKQAKERFNKSMSVFKRIPEKKNLPKK